jgi:hypothetical protein
LNNIGTQSLRLEQPLILKNFKIYSLSPSHITLTHKTILFFKKNKIKSWVAASLLPNRQPPLGRGGSQDTLEVANGGHRATLEQIKATPSLKGSSRTTLKVGGTLLIFDF